MGIFKNDVGRPSNETIRIRFVLKLLVIILVIIFLFLFKYYFKEEKKEENKNIIVNETIEKEKSPNYDGINIENIITTYKLDNISELINNEKTLFRKFAYHTINNQNITFEDKKHLLELFEVVIEYNNKNDISNLLNKIDVLQIKTYETRPEGMLDFSVGHYVNSKVLIEIIAEYYNSTIKHELMHFISYSLNNKNDYVYYCNNEFIGRNEIKEMSSKEQSKCIRSEFITFNNFLEEASAEFISDYLYEDGMKRVYNNSVEIYLLFQYILEDDFSNIYYSSERNLMFMKLFNKKLGYNLEETYDLINNTSKLPYSEYETDKLKQAYDIYAAANEIVNAYKKKKIGNFKDNKLLNLVLFNMLKDHKTNVQLYLNSNSNKNLENQTELMNLEFDEYRFLVNTLKEENLYFFTSTRKLKKIDNQIVVYYLTAINGKLYDINIYFDKYGNVNDVKKVEVTKSAG